MMQFYYSFKMISIFYKMSNKISNKIDYKSEIEISHYTIQPYEYNVYTIRIFKRT